MADFKATDHLRHSPDSSGRMRDSLFWQTTLPAEEVGFQAYLYLTAAGKAGFNVVLWGDRETPLAIEFAQDQVPADMDLDHFSFKGLEIRQTGFGEPVQLDYASERMTLSLRFTGLHRAFSYHDNPDGLPSWFARNRYEQTGWIEGFVESGSRRIELDGMGHRDHSWGNRNWGMPQHWKWFTAYTPDGSRMINGWIWMARGELGCAGYVVRDGELVAIRTICQRASYDPDMSQRHLHAEIVDVAGGVCVVELERFGLVKLPTKDKLGTIIQEAACRATIDGLSGAGQYETHWQQGYIDHLVETNSTR